MHVIGVAKPDCDYKDPKKIVMLAGQEGCPRQAQFKIYIKNVDDGAFKDKPLHACRTHAPVLFQGLLAMGKEMRRLKENVRVFVEDLDQADPEKKMTKILVKKGGTDKGLDRRKLNAFLSGRKRR